MKKITLLLVAAVFAIGIQSCSTDEIGIEEENLSKVENNIPENAIHITTQSKHRIPDPDVVIYKRIFVRYPVGTTYYERWKKATVEGPRIFDDFYVVLDNGCNYVDEWFVRCYTCSDYPQGKSEVVEEENLPDTDVNDDEFGQESNNIRYWFCSEVPLIYLNQDILVFGR